MEDLVSGKSCQFSMPHLDAHGNLTTAFMEPSTDVSELEKKLEFAQISNDLDELLADGDNDQLESELVMAGGGHRRRRGSMNKQKYKAMRPWKPLGTREYPNYTFISIFSCIAAFLSFI